MKTVVFFAIIKKGMGSYFLEKARQAGSTGGTIIRAEGTVPDPLLDLLGISESKREMLLMIVDKDKEAQMHRHLTQECDLPGKGKGIAFSIDTTSVYCSHNVVNEFSRGDQELGDYQLIATIVNRDLGDEVVAAARKEGAGGATILHGRGLGAEKAAKLFNITIEPEKEIVLMIVETTRVEEIIDRLRAALNLDQPGKGILFSVDVNNVNGLFQEVKNKQA